MCICLSYVGIIIVTVTVIYVSVLHLVMLTAVSVCLSVSMPHDISHYADFLKYPDSVPYSL